MAASAKKSLSVPRLNTSFPRATINRACIRNLGEIRLGKFGQVAHYNDTLEGIV